MKKLLLILSAFALLLQSCYDDTALWNHIKTLEKAMYQQQIDALKAFVESLKKVDTEIKNTIIALQETDADVRTRIAALKDMDATLDGKIDALEAQVENDNLTTKNWAESTFATLEQYNGLVTNLSELNDLMASELADVKSQIQDNYAALTESITSTSNDIRSWVETALKNYAANEELQATATGLQEQLNALSGRLDVLELRVNALETQVAAINASISSLEEMDRLINGTIEQLKSADVNAQTQIDALTAYDQTLKAAIDGLSALHEVSITTTKDWAETTFATLEQYNGLVTNLSGLNDLMASELAGVKSQIQDNYAALTESITTTSSDIRSWVDATLAHYATNDALQSLSTDLTSRLDDLSGKLNTLEEKVNNLEDLLAGLTREFTINYSVSKVVIEENSSATISYTITGATSSTSVKAVCPGGWSASVTPTDASSGTITINSPSSFTENEILVFVYDGEHRTIMSSLLCIKPIDLSLAGTANCYVISQKGGYKFKAVKGNGVEPVGAVATTEVLWESFGTSEKPKVGDLITDASFSDDYVYFATPSTFKEGNAVIAAKDASDTILWSWHIWLTDQPEDQVYNNNAGTMMDRNLGATSATPGDVGALGLLYQWGRKDPFLGSSSISSRTTAASTITWPSADESDFSNGTIDYATAHPTTFITDNRNNYDWKYNQDDTRWQSSKTIYDPCPVGYRVPDGGDSGVWSKAFGSSSSFSGSYDSTNKGFNFGPSGSGSKKLTTNVSTCWYPAAGYLYCGDGSLNNVGYHGYYWSCTPDGRCACLLLVNYNGSVSPSYYYYRAYGRSVRCQKIK